MRHVTKARHTERSAAQRDARVRGQAMIEMVVGLLAMMLLMVGLLQIGRFSIAHNRAQLTARERADRQAIQPTYTPPMAQPVYMRDWDEGVDGVRYTQHDVPVLGAAPEVGTEILVHAHPAQVSAYTDSQPWNDLQASPQVMESLRFVRGFARSAEIPVYPLMQRLVVHDESLSMEQTVWMPWLQGIDE